MKHPLALACVILLASCAAPGGAVRSPDGAVGFGEATTAGFDRVSPRAALPRDHEPEEGDRRIIVGAGFTDDPDGFLLQGQADFYQSERIAIGPALQWGIDDGVTIFAPSFHGKLVFPPEDGGETLLMPFLQAGAGIAYINKDRGGDDWGLMLQAGGGLEVRLDEQYGLVSTLMINFLPGDVEGEGAYLSWQIIGLSMRF